jgi:hypothetical protein
MRRPILLALTLSSACFAAPKVDVPDLGEGSTGISLDEGDEEPYVPTEATGGATTGEVEGDATSSADDPAGSDDAGTVEPETTADADATGTDDGGGGSFPPAEPFGDDVRELDLVGTWTMPWEPTGVADVTIAIAADGTFTWRETEADCSDAGSASGVLWVEGSQLVVHVDAWDKKDPWDVEGALGEPLALPFRMRLGYAPMGGFLGIAAPTRLTDVEQWRGVGWVRLDAGTGPQGAWVAEAELWAIPAEASEPQLLVRDRFSATLISGGNAVVEHAWTWWWPQQGIEEVDVDNGGWTDETPGNMAGAATIDGDLFAYDAAHMMAFATDRAFKLGVVSDCP